MSKPSKNECCKIDAVVTVDAKGQIVLPKDMREKAHINPNDKLALIAMQKNAAVCCIVLMKTDAFENPVKRMLGPIFDEALSNKGETQ